MPAVPEEKHRLAVREATEGIDHCFIENLIGPYYRHCHEAMDMTGKRDKGQT